MNTADRPFHFDQSDIRTGLSSAEAKSRFERDGPNEVPEKKSHPFLSLARKFWGLSAWMLELIAALSFVLGKTTDFWIAIALLVVNAALSFLQEQRASAAVVALRRQYAYGRRNRPAESALRQVVRSAGMSKDPKGKFLRR